MGAESAVSKMEKLTSLEILPPQTSDFSIAGVHIHLTSNEDTQRIQSKWKVNRFIFQMCILALPTQETFPWAPKLNFSGLSSDWPKSLIQQILKCVTLFHGHCGNLPF